jgi:hypothetical protein
VLPRRPGARFALEALFLVLLAVGAGLADLRPLVIVLVMAGAWALVGLAELSAERLDRSPLSYLQPQPALDDEEEPEEVFGPRPEERTVVAPPEPEPAVEADQERPPPLEERPEPEEVAEAEAEAEPEPEPELEPEPVLPEQEPAGWIAQSDESPAEATQEPPPPPRRLRALLRRREPEVEPEPAAPPRHVKLLPRRPADEPSPASREVAELFGPAPEEEPAQSEENRR